MNQLQNIFNYHGHEVRTVNMKGSPWFVAKDVCEVLEIRNHRDAVSRLTRAMKDDVGIPDAIGRDQNTTIVSEAGLYKLIFTSNKPEAEAFSNWVAAEVLPAIRRTGTYTAPSTSPGQLMVQAFEQMAEVAKRMHEHEETLLVHDERIGQLDHKVTNRIQIDHGLQRSVQKAVAKRVYQFEDDPRARTKLFRELYRELKDRFGVASYRDIREIDYDAAVNYIAAWVPKRV